MRITVGENRHQRAAFRRFGVGTLLIITTMYGVLFGGMQALGLSPMAFLLSTVFFTAVGLGQMLLFRGERPRLASMIVGAAFLAYLWFGGFIFMPLGTRSLFTLSVVVGYLMVLGATAGYLAGTFIAGVFLVIHKVRCLWKAEHHGQKCEPRAE